MSLEHLFATSVLSLAVPDTSVEFPPTDPSDEWLETLTSNAQERKQAFFDEQLQSLLTLRVEHPTPNEPADPSHPPAALITFLAHVQVSLEASYISSVPTSVDTPQAARLSLPPRTASLGGLKPSARGGPHHPSILPPNTPNPTPATADHDRKYVASQGTLLFTSIWGQSTADDSQEGFALIWSERESVWVAVYRLALTISFLRLTFTDPLLCLTISATLREKPVTTSSTQHPFIRFLKSFDGVVIPESPTVVDKAPAHDDSDNLDGFEEVNLLEGLLAGPTFSRMAPDMNLPSVRLGTVSRQKLFSLPPVNLPSPGLPTPSPRGNNKAQSTLRKSFRKTLSTVSGFRVRMRTVFVPSIVLDATQTEHDKMASGSEERTVVLCVEIENSGESGEGVGFEVESVDVSISGDEAKATLITWGRETFTSQDDEVFPLKIAQWAQYNLLYAVTFLRSPEELDAFSFARKTTNTAHTDLQRAVSINIHGKPYYKPPTFDTTTLIYPTRTFSSKWNCVLDLASHQSQSQRPTNPPDPGDPSTAYPSVLPEPPSPFPVFGLQTSKQSPTTALQISSSSTPTTDTARSGGGQLLMAGRVVKSSTPRMSSFPIPVINSNPSRMSLPPNLNTTYARSPTTYSAPPDPHHHPHNERPYSMYSIPPLRTHTPPILDTPPPITPAYPAFPPRSMPGGGVPQTPMIQSHAPIVSQMSGGVVGPSLEARRGRGGGLSPGGAGEPLTPVPGSQFQQMQMQQHGAAGANVGGAVADASGGDTVVISVGLLNVVKSGGIGREKKVSPASEDHQDGDDEEESDSASTSASSSPSNSSSTPDSETPSTGLLERIYPLDSFTLDIFVFNKSDRTRRFEISCVEKKRRRRGGVGGDRDGAVGPGADVGADGGGGAGTAKKMGYPGIMPMEGRVRIGPLLPSACQSVRMEFLAVSPGVHSIEALTLTDIESGYSINLRSVMDIVVHNPDD
ncbi:hypothetical protein NP233_g946 [Leucocoprinus birnbaumii]|uniref:Trafficking protein particle complex II-specific subunit 65 IgD3 domain-containing protein n=1 Tax=Leucocoprinus birnbaumii TaxID=56174 RepID=A0AAD5YVB5_9AGAR|nr:hypothetical protein NP233_g946 [Leucocoprinus birnbaumii]